MPKASTWAGSVRTSPVVEREPLQRGDHLLPAGQMGAGVGAEFAAPREPHRDHRGEQAEHLISSTITMM